MVWSYGLCVHVSSPVVVGIEKLTTREVQPQCLPQSRQPIARREQAVKRLKTFSICSNGGIDPGKKLSIRLTGSHWSHPHTASLRKPAERKRESKIRLSFYYCGNFFAGPLRAYAPAGPDVGLGDRGRRRTANIGKKRNHTQAVPVSRAASVLSCLLF